MKRYYLVLLIILAFAGLFYGLFAATQRDKVDTFDIAIYQDRITQFSSDRTVGEIHNSKNAKKEAEAIFMEVFGIAETDYKPYYVKYDPQSDVWLVFGSLPSLAPGTIIFGSSPCVLMQSNGDVLAIWLG